MRDDQFTYAPDGTAYCRKCGTRAMSSAAAHMLLHLHFLNDRFGKPEYNRSFEMWIEAA